VYYLELFIAVRISLYHKISKISYNCERSRRNGGCTVIGCTFLFTISCEQNRSSCYLSFQSSFTLHARSSWLVTWCLGREVCPRRPHYLHTSCTTQTRSRIEQQHLPTLILLEFHANATRPTTVAINSSTHYMASW
jgi:hypothetical protein